MYIIFVLGTAIIVDIFHFFQSRGETSLCHEAVIGQLLTYSLNLHTQFQRPCSDDSMFKSLVKHLQLQQLCEGRNTQNLSQDLQKVHHLVLHMFPHPPLVCFRMNYSYIVWLLKRNHKSANCLAMTMVHSSLSPEWFNCQYFKNAFIVSVKILVSNIW